MDKKLNWKCHFNKTMIMIKTCYIRVKTLYSIKHYLSINELKWFRQSLVLSFSCYMSDICGHSRFHKFRRFRNSTCPTLATALSSTFQYIVIQQDKPVISIANTIQKLITVQVFLLQLYVSLE